LPPCVIAVPSLQTSFLPGKLNSPESLEVLRQSGYPERLGSNCQAIDKQELELGAMGDIQAGSIWIGLNAQS